VRLYDGDARLLSSHAMAPHGAPEDGYFEVTVPGIGPGALYRFVVGERELPDPYARYLPHGVHGPAMVMDSRFEWRHGMGVSRPLDQQILYEVHVGRSPSREPTTRHARV